MVVDGDWRSGSIRYGQYRNAQRSTVRCGVTVVVRSHVAGGYLTGKVERGVVRVATVGVHRQRAGRNDVAVEIRAEYRYRRTDRHRVVRHAVTVQVNDNRGHHLDISLGVAVVRQQVTVGRRIDGRLVDVVLGDREVLRCDRRQV